MVKTIDKIVVSILVVLLIGMGSVFITAIADEGSKNSDFINKQLVVKDVTMAEKEFAMESNLEEQEDDEESEVAITGSALEKAAAAALAFIGEGSVTDSEIGDEEGYYEIEITLDNGNEVDVHLNENFNVISTEYENEEDDD